MNKLWQAEIPFHSSDEFLEMLMAMVMFFDNAVVRLPMLDEDQPYYDVKMWSRICRIASRLGYLEGIRVNAFNELSLAKTMIDVVPGVPASETETGYLFDLMTEKYVDDHLECCVPEEELFVKEAMKFLTLVQEQNIFRLSDLLSVLYAGRNTASDNMDAALLYNEAAKKYKLDECVAFTSEKILFPYYEKNTIATWTHSDRVSFWSILADSRTAKKEMRGQLAESMSGRYPDDSDELNKYVLWKVNTEVERYNSLLLDGKQSYVEAIRRELGEPSGYVGVSLSYFAGMEKHIRHAAECGDILKFFSVPYLPYKAKRRKRPVFLKFETIKDDEELKGIPA